MKRLVPLAVAALAVVSHQSALAQGSNLKVYGMLAYVAPLATTDQTVGGVTDAVKASKELGFSLGFEFRPGSLIGVEFDYLHAKHDLKHDTAGLLGETTFQPISATLNLHVPLGGIDLHGGPTAAYVNWGDLKAPSGGETKVDAEFAFGVSAGADVDILPRLAATGGVRWLNLKVQPQGGEAVDVHPLFARIGVAAKF